MTTNKRWSLDAKYATEAPLTKKVKDWLEVQPDIMFYKASDRYNKGISDFIICVGGIFVAAELKAETNVASAQQKLFIKQINEAGGVAGECFTVGEVIKLVEHARKLARCE